MRSAIFESSLLDDMYKDQSMHMLINVLGDRGLFKWYNQTDHGAIEFWHSYLVKRVRTETNPNLRRYYNIREIAERANIETGTDLDIAIDVLCWPALKIATDSRSDAKLEQNPSDPNLDLLCAAACLDLVELANRLLHEGACPTNKSNLFSSPMRLAAWFGNTNILSIFQNHIKDDWTGKAEPGSIKGAAIRGDMDVVRLAYPPSRATPSSDKYDKEPFGTMQRLGATKHTLYRAQLCTKMPEVHRHLNNFIIEPSELDHQLAVHSRLGNLEMVRYLLDAGADTLGSCGRIRNPLAEACRRCHDGIVDLLLERGVSNFRRLPYFHIRTLREWQ